MITRAVQLKVDGIDIVGRLYSPGVRDNLPAVCICHGIPSGNPPAPGDGGYPALAERICQEGFAVFIFNFRGAGESGGNLDMLGWTKDLKAALDYLCGLPEVDRSRLYLCGFSAGAAVSVYVASLDKRVSGVAVCACPAEFTFGGVNDPQALVKHFRSIRVIRDPGFPESIENWYASFRQVSPIQYVAGISPRPLLILHGNGDETVDITHAYRLYERAGEPKQMVVIEGAGHRLRLDERAVKAVTHWLRSHIAHSGEKGYN